MFSLASPGGAESPPSERAAAVRTTPEGTIEATGAGRAWSSARRAAEGTTLDAAWFRGRRSVVYLMPPGGGRAMRPVASAVMRELWSAGDWETDHVFVGGAVSAPIFAISRRIGTMDAEREVDRVAAQRGESAEAIAKVVRPHVFCVHDREGSLWQELLGPDDGATARVDADEELPVAVLVLDGGRVVGTMEVDREADASAGDDLGRIVAEVRGLLGAGESVASR